MNNDALNELWNSAPNRPLPEAGERLAVHFLTRLRKRRLYQGWWLAWTFLALTGTTALAVVQIVKHGSTAVTGQWALWPMLALPWGAAFLFLRRYFRECVAPTLSVSPLHAALVAARAGNLMERRRLIGVGILLLAMLPITALAIWQLHLAGKTTADQAWSMALVFGLALALGGGFVTWRYRRHLVPERCKIEALLRALESTNAS
jgi:LPXTG-motif cell wall-anchored protein